MNELLLKRVRRHILRYPERFDMDDWRCGSVACIAGRAALLIYGVQLREEDGSPRIPGRRQPDDWCQLGARLMGLRRVQAWALFDVACWPSDLRTAYERAAERRDRRRAARVAARRIDAFLGGDREPSGNDLE